MGSAERATRPRVGRVEGPEELAWGWVYQKKAQNVEQRDVEGGRGDLISACCSGGLRLKPGTGPGGQASTSVVDVVLGNGSHQRSGEGWNHGCIC